MNALSSTPKRSRYSYKVCGHCNRELSVKKYREHKRFHFQEDTQSWVKEIVNSDDGSATTEISSLDDFEVGFGATDGTTLCPGMNFSEINDSDDCFEDPIVSDHENVTVRPQGTVYSKSLDVCTSKRHALEASIVNPPSCLFNFPNFHQISLLFYAQ